MRIDQNADSMSLAALGADATRLLCSGRIDALVSKFGYALAHHREPAAAVREDLSRCLAALAASSLVPDTGVPIVKFMEPNDAKLFALVECLAIADNGRCVLIELVVAGDDRERHISLEDISAA